MSHVKKIEKIEKELDAKLQDRDRLTKQYDALMKSLRRINTDIANLHLEKRGITG